MKACKKFSEVQETKCKQAYLFIEVWLQLLFCSQGILSEGDADGRTPLHIACKENNVSIVKLLLTEGASKLN